MAKNLEYIKDGKTEYCFAGNFDMLEKLENTGHDLAGIFNELSSGALPLLTISNILAASLQSKDAVNVLETDKAELIKSIIDRYGLQEAGIVARLMLSYSMVGSVKKHQMDRDEITRGLMSQIIGSESMSLKRRGLLWMAHWASSVVLACLIFSALNQHF